MPPKRKPEGEIATVESIKKRQPTTIIDLTSPSPPASPVAAPDVPSVSSPVTVPVLASNLAIASTSLSTAAARIYEYEVHFTFTEFGEDEETNVGVFPTAESANKAGRKAIRDIDEWNEYEEEIDGHGMIYIETDFPDLPGSSGKVEVIRRMKQLSLVSATIAAPGKATCHEYEVTVSFSGDLDENDVVRICTNVKAANGAARKALDEYGAYDNDIEDIDEDGLLQIDEVRFTELEGNCYGRVEIIKRVKKAGAGNQASK